MTRHSSLRLPLAVLATALVFPLYATPSSIAGTVVLVKAYGDNPGTLVFQLTNQPTTGCANNSYFEMSPTTVTDAESRRNMYAALLAAKLTGNPLRVTYDTGSFCDTFGFPAVYAVDLE